MREGGTSHIEKIHSGGDADRIALAQVEAEAEQEAELDRGDPFHAAQPPTA